MKDEVIAILQSHGFQRNSPMILGYSGGVDSLALGHVLVTNGFHIQLGIFDHQLRQDSGEDVERALNQAREWGVPIATETAPIRDEADHLGLSIEATGRLFRYRFLFRIAENYGASAVLTAHHADDQVETVLLHLVRGSGIGGLGGMKVVENLVQWHPMIPLVRPLLKFWRDEIRDYCASNGLVPIEDASNSDVSYSRNRLRHEVVPGLEKINPRVKESVLRLAEIAREDNAALEAVVDSSEGLWCIGDSKGKIEFVGENFGDAPLAIQRRWLLRRLRNLFPNREISLEHVDQVLVWLNQSITNKVMKFSFGLVGHRRDGIVILGVEDGRLFASLDFPNIGSNSIAVSIPGEANLENGWVLRFELAGEKSSDQLKGGELADHSEMLFSLKCVGNSQVVLRRHLPGERLRPFGMGGKRRKLSDIFIDANVPSYARAAWPIVCVGDEIIWIPGLVASEFGRLREMPALAVRGVLVKQTTG